MSANALVPLRPRRVEKPWGWNELPPQFSSKHSRAGKIGEIWFENPERSDLPLLIKYLFTSERLSVQVHPDDALAEELGRGCGKDEAWLILDAEPGATIGTGLEYLLSPVELRAAALDGSIENLLKWRPVAKGECYYSPAGTIHAIGPGLVLLEVQQNVDLTYRLYDYGRPRELHLDKAIRAAHPGSMARRIEARPLCPFRSVVAEGPAFQVERWRGETVIECRGTPERPFWLMPLEGVITADERLLEPGSAWVVNGTVSISLSEASSMIAATLPE